MKNFFKTFNLLMIAFFAMIAFLFISCDQNTNDPVPMVDPASAKGKPQNPSGNLVSKDNPASQNKIFAEIRQATARYHQVEVAESEGYVKASDCVSGPAGGMGHHYHHMGHLLDGVVDPSKPELLVYEPMKNGKLRLVAVEFMIIAEQWDALNEDPPMLGDKVFDDHRPEGSSGPPIPHYQLHVWVWKNNPAGMYAPLNPNVSCQFAE